MSIRRKRENSAGVPTWPFAIPLCWLGSFLVSVLFVTDFLYVEGKKLLRLR